MTKKFIIVAKAALAGVAALAVLSCSRDVWEENDVKQEEPALCRTITFHAQEVKTKAQFGTPDNGVYPTLWTSSDTEAKISLNCGSAVTASVNPSQDGVTSTLNATVDFTGIDGPYTFYAVSPSSAATALSPSRRSWKVSIPCEQTPTSTSVDGNAIILASASAPFGSSAQISDVDLQFSHLTAYGRLTLTDIDLIPSGATVQGVELTATTPLVGDWFWACDETSQGEHTLLDYGASSTVTIHTSSLSDVWFACAPVDLSDQMMYVRVLTDQGILEKLIYFDGTYKLEAGCTAVFSVNMSEQAGTSWISSSGTGSGSGTGAFTLVTEASTLQAGDEVLIVYISGSLALGALNSSGNFRDPEEVTIANNEIASEGSATVLTLEAGSTSGTWAFKDGSVYLCSASSKNYLKNSSTKDANSSWVISITSTGVASIVAQAGSSTILSYNTSNPRFSCYSNTDQQPVAIFRRNSGGSAGVSANDPLLQETEYGAYLGTNLTWQLAAGEDQVTRSYNDSDVLTYTLINAADVEELEISGYKKSYVKSDQVTVTVNWRRGFSSVLTGQQYTMYVIKEQGPKVWLSDGNGHGVIIKK